MTIISDIHEEPNPAVLTTSKPLQPYVIESFTVEGRKAGRCAACGTSFIHSAAESGRVLRCSALYLPQPYKHHVHVTASCDETGQRETACLECFSR